VSRQNEDSPAFELKLARDTAMRNVRLGFEVLERIYGGPPTGREAGLHSTIGNLRYALDRLEIAHERVREAKA
jgi:hypothetical protein